MTKALKYVLIIFFLLNSHSFAKEDFFAEAKNLFDNEKYEESKFLLQRNIVFNPKDSKSYLYLAKIYKTEENERQREEKLRERYGKERWIIGCPGQGDREGGGVQGRGRGRAPYACGCCRSTSRCWAPMWPPMWCGGRGASHWSSSRSRASLPPGAVAEHTAAHGVLPIWRG